MLAIASFIIHYGLASGEGFWATCRKWAWSRANWIEVVDLRSWFRRDSAWLFPQPPSLIVISSLRAVACGTRSAVNSMGPGECIADTKV
jgi:hypothetical protein